MSLAPAPAPARAQALILAAGRGERMRPLTDSVPKPLLEVHGKPLIRWSIDALAEGGFTDLVINTAWLGEQIPARLGEAPARGPGAAPSIRFSNEGRDFGQALETAGGIVRALPLLDDVFWVVAGDVYMPDFRFTREAVRRFVGGENLAHLWLVPNPAHNVAGDFGIDARGRAMSEAKERFTFSTVALYRASFFTPPYCKVPAGNPSGVRAALAPMLRAAMKDARVSAELYTGAWTDVGTPARLAQLNATPAPGHRDPGPQGMFAPTTE